MHNEGRQSDFDPYRTIGPNLERGDALNRWILLRPRQRIVQILKGQRVLDVCCGTGSLTAMLVAAGCQVTGVDSSPTMLSYARRKGLTAEFIRMDATQLPIYHEFDAAVISLAIHEMSSQAREQVWVSMNRAVRSGGRLIALDFAAPKRNSLLARITSGLIEQDERGTLTYDPHHYENYREFMRGGGLLSWVKKWDQALEADDRFWGGTIAIVVTRSKEGFMRPSMP